MKLLKTSKQWMSYFNKHFPLQNISFTHKTDRILHQLYEDIYEAHQYVKRDYRSSIHMKRITSASQMSRPVYFHANSFPTSIQSHLEEHMKTEISFSTSLYDRKVRLIIVSEKEMNMEECVQYIKSIMLWLHIVHKYASKKCVQSITIYIYLTSLLKKLPHNATRTILDENHVNTAFTTTCPVESEIVVFRKEEWFKVLIHETFHNFGLDYSMMSNSSINQCILSIFDVHSKVNSYEAYTECWAEIMNVLLCSFTELKNKGDVDTFLRRSEEMLNVERKYSFFQMVKTLDFMGLTYKDMYSASEVARQKRKMYKEHSNVLSYYVLKTILLNNVQGFLDWCDKHNSSLLNFTKTMVTQRSFCEFIERHYKSKSMLDGVHASEVFLGSLKRRITPTSHVLNNMRMSICEMG